MADPAKNGASAEGGNPPAAKPPDEDKAHQAIDRRLLARLWGYLLPYRGAVIACFAMTIAVALLRLAQPILIHGVLEHEVMESDIPGIAAKSLLLLGLIIGVLALDIGFNWVSGVVGQRAMHDLRMQVFRHVNTLDVAYFDRTPVGRLITRMTSDISSLAELFTTGVIAMLAEMLMLAGLLAIMMTYSLRLTLVVFCSVPFMLLAVGLFRRHSRKWYLEVRGRLARMNSYLQENIAGMMTVQSFNREARNLAAFGQLNDSYRAAQVQTILAFALFYPALNIILNLTIAGVIWVGGKSVISGSFLGGAPITFATLFLFVQTVNMLFTPLRNLSEKYNILQAAMASSARIFSLLDARPQVVSAPDARKIERIERGIKFEGVRFEYLPGEPVLRDISFEIERGQTAAVVGATGSGKSTLVNLLTRFYDAKAGRIAIDGTDIRDIELGSLRGLFAVVLQEVFLFSDTIAGNLRMANPALTDEQIWEVLARVRADDFVRVLPGGIEARVRERGGGFSTGQKQLLAFARALAADPQVLILDEATANVDTATEHRIQEAIASMLSGRTALVIAHRISTIQKADKILVMHKGEIRERGTHEELIAADGLYRRLYELQYGEQAEAEAEEAPAEPGGLAPAARLAP